MIITFNQMPTNININNISGATPFNFQVPVILDNKQSYNLKVVDNNGCISISNILI